MLGTQVRGLFERHGREVEFFAPDVVFGEAERYLPARARIERRDPNDWPVLACALTLDCPIWTEDDDFFGVGMPVWTSDRVEIFFGYP